MKIGIIGVGFVGGAVKHYFSAKGGSAFGGESSKHQVFVYDKYKHLGSVEEINEADIIFVCVPTPFYSRSGFDISAVTEAIKVLKQPKVVVIKSSIIPGTTDKLQKRFPKHKILFNPEFLTEARANYDMAHPSRQILGFTSKSRSAANQVMRILPTAPYKKIMPALDAEVVKYMANAFLALRVVYANEFFDISKKLGANYKTVKEAVARDPRIGDSHFSVKHGGYRGYGGSCFPKDVNAIIQLAEKKNIRTPLLKEMRKINRGLLKAGGISEEYFLSNKHKKRR